MENENAVTVAGNTNIRTTLDSIDNVNKFTTMKLETEEQLTELYNATQECDVKLNDIVGTTIEIRDIYIEERLFTQIDEETGELKEVSKYRTILFGTDGKTYVAGAYGIFNSISQILGMFGKPSEEKPFTLEVKKRPIGNGKETLVLKKL